MRATAHCPLALASALAVATSSCASVVQPRGAAGGSDVVGHGADAVAIDAAGSRDGGYPCPRYALRWLRTWTEPADIGVLAVADSAGRLTIAGSYIANEPTLFGVPTPVHQFLRRGFVARFDAEGIVRSLRTCDRSLGRPVVDADSNVTLLVNGNTLSRGMSCDGEGQSNLLPQSPGLVSFDAAGRLRWTRVLPPLGRPYAHSVDRNSNVFVAGVTTSARADFGGGPIESISRGATNSFFVASYDRLGGFRWAYRFGRIGSAWHPEEIEVAATDDDLVYLASTIYPGEGGEDIGLAVTTESRFVAAIEHPFRTRWASAWAAFARGVPVRSQARDLRWRNGEMYVHGQAGVGGGLFGLRPDQTSEVVLRVGYDGAPRLLLAATPIPPREEQGFFSAAMDVNSRGEVALLPRFPRGARLRDRFYECAWSSCTVVVVAAPSGELCWDTVFEEHSSDPSQVVFDPTGGFYLVDNSGGRNVAPPDLTIRFPGMEERRGTAYIARFDEVGRGP